MLAFRRRRLGLVSCCWCWVLWGVRLQNLEHPHRGYSFVCVVFRRAATQGRCLKLKRDMVSREASEQEVHAYTDIICIVSIIVVMDTVSSNCSY